MIDQINQIIDFIEQYKYLAAIIYIFLSFIIAFIVDKVIISLLKKIVKKSDTELDDKLIEVFHKPIYNSILFIGFYVALSSLQLPEKINFVFIGMLKTVVVFYWVISFFKALNVIIKSNYQGNKGRTLVRKKTLPLVDNIGKILIFIIAIYFLMLSWNINVTAIGASLGLFSLAIGLAAKDTLGNLFAGIFIMADSPYKEGDYINLDTGERGYVTTIGLRSTRIMTRDDIEITIPNSVIATTKIVNESGGPHEKERVRVDVDIAYGSDLEKAKNILNDIALNSQNVCKDPEPRVRLRLLGESGLRIQLLFWIEKPELRGFVIDEITSEIYNRFNSENIDIPFPQRTLHIKKDT